MRGSVFDDPGDEKSWRVSQRGAGLTAHFAGREPSWYRRAIEPLKGVDSVLDLGCGLGLTLEALREQGATRVLGVDRWFTFMQRATEATPMIAHDLTLPMPFLRSGSFDAVFSHYVLDYMSPIGMRQVLREAHRMLSPGGLLLVYVAGVGLGGSDIARTAPYTPPVLSPLLEEAGFDEINVEARDNGRNSVVKATRSPRDVVRPPVAVDGIHVHLDGDTQLSAAFPEGGESLGCELSGDGRAATLSFDLPRSEAGQGTGEAGHTGISVCLRTLALRPRGTELRIWVWRGATSVVSECLRLEFIPAELSVRCSGEIEHCSVWTPGELSLEPLGDAYARQSDLPVAAGLSEIERAAEGRRIVVERPGEARVDIPRLLGDGRNRFLVRRARNLAVADVDEDWAGGRAHGIVLAADELGGGGAVHELLRWARWRGALIFVDGGDWEGIAATVSWRLEPPGPVVLVDPVLGRDRDSAPLPAEVVELAAARRGTFVLLAGPSRDRTAKGDLERLRGRLLHGGPAGADRAGTLEANETLRYLTERTQLLQLRQWRPFSWAEVGRRPVTT